MKLKFNQETREINTEDIKNNQIEVDFNGKFCILFDVSDDNKTFTARNGMNGWGENIREQIEGKKAKVID